MSASRSAAAFPSDEDKRQAAREVARGYLWPKLRRARRNVIGLLHVWRFTLVASGQHGTAAASLARGLADLGADEAMAPLRTPPSYPSRPPPA